MPIYTYKARGKQGELFTATIESENELKLAANLRSLGYSVISVEKESQLKVRLVDFWQKIRKTR